MDLIILDPTVSARLVKQRRKLGLDRLDEVWDRAYVMSPLADDEHQEITTNLASCLVTVIAVPRLGKVRAGANVSDRVKGWKQNYRCPDVVVYLNDTTAQQHKSFWLGGPSFGVEVVSHHDRSRAKLDFYARIGTRELLLVDRYPWALEVYRLNAGDAFDLVGKSTLDQPSILTSVVLPLTLRLQPGTERPTIAVQHADNLQTWSV